MCPGTSLDADAQVAIVELFRRRDVFRTLRKLSLSNISKTCVCFFVFSVWTNSFFSLMTKNIHFSPSSNHNAGTDHVALLDVKTL